MSIIQTIRTMRAIYEAKLSVCPDWDDGQREYLEAMIRQSHLDEETHAPASKDDALTPEKIRVLKSFSEYMGNFRCTNAQARDLAEACTAALKALGLS